MRKIAFSVVVSICVLLCGCKKHNSPVVQTELISETTIAVTEESTVAATYETRVTEPVIVEAEGELPFVSSSSEDSSDGIKENEDSSESVNKDSTAATEAPQIPNATEEAASGGNSNDFPFVPAN